MAQMHPKEELLDLVFRNEDKDATERKRVAAPTEKAAPTTSASVDNDYLTFVRVIPTAQEHIPCQTEDCSKDTAVSWASNTNRNHTRNFYELCQVIKRGGWPEGIRPIKYLTVPLVDLINIDDFKIWLASFLEEMSAEKYQNFCLQVDEGCDTITTTDNKLSYGFSKCDQDHCTFLKKGSKEIRRIQRIGAQSLRNFVCNPNYT